MNIIKNNPFRILGLPANSSERELQKRIAIVKRFADVGQSKEFDYDFSFLGEFNRSIDEVQKASSRIEQMPQKVHNALFWFTEKGKIDETAINYLKENNIEKATEIWQKTLKEEVTDKNYLSYANLSTLLIGIASTNGSVKKDLLQQGIQLKGKLLNSENLQHFISDITGNGTIAETDKLNSEFINEILTLTKTYISKGQLTQREILSFFSTFPASVIKAVSSKFSETHVFNIENEIEKTSERRNATPRNAGEQGEELYKKTKVDITELKNIFGKDNIQFQMVANKLANEILQCSIDFFNTHREEDGEFDPGDDALRIAKLANTVGASGQIKERIIESMQSIQEWVDGKEKRKEGEKIKEDIDFVVSKLKSFQNQSNSISNARNLVSNCKPKLLNIKNIVGYNNEIYLHLSSGVANNALGMIIDIVNREQEALQYDKSKIFTLKETLNNAVTAINEIGSLDMVSELRTRYNTNKVAIGNISSQLNQVVNQISNASRSSSSSSSGCYIATMVYGSYEHPQVLVLRQFRDNTLATNYLGKTFIKIYYALSPKFVEMFKNSKKTNKLIKSILDKIISKIK